MAEVRNRKIFAGYYRRYDRKVFYVVSEASDYDTGEITVILQEYSLTRKMPYITMSRKSFCEVITLKDGKKVDKFTRDTSIPISSSFVEELETDKLRGPVRHKKNDKDEYSIREFQRCYSYLEYAKDIVNNYSLDRKRLEICIEKKRAIGVKNAEEFKKMKTDIYFLESLMKSILSEYNDYFIERFVEKKSIRKYAAEHNLNRGSVNHIGQKFYTALAEQLATRDKYEGVCRLLKTKE